MSNGAGKHRTAVHSVYLIDDSDGDTFLTRRLLKRDKVQAQLQSFSSIEQFQHYATTNTDFDAAQSLLIIDLYLAHEQAMETLPLIVQQYPQLPVGICTGSEDPQDKTDALAAGAWFFVGKPLDRACLFEICQQIETLHLCDATDGSTQLQLDNA